MLRVGACARSSAPAPARTPAALDSLVLARGACYGICETYEVVVRRDGTATVWRKSVASRVNVAPDEARGLLTSGVGAGLLTLPSRIQADSALCPLQASDHSTITLTAYAGARINRVEHYTGCYADHELRVAARLERLVILERRVDALVSGNAPP